MTPDNIIAAARRAVGTPFRHQGRAPGVALDCAGLALHVAGAVGVAAIDKEGYPRQPFGGVLEATLNEQPGLVQVFAMLPGDILLMRFKAGPQHLGIVTGTTLIHAYAPSRIVCEHDFTPEWAARVVAIYRFVGVDHG